MKASIIQKNLSTKTVFTPRSAQKGITYKEQCLARFANSILSDQEHAFSLSRLMQKLNLSRNQVIKAYVEFDLDIYDNTNQMYDLLMTRFILHMHNLLKGSWHQERQKTLQAMIKQCAPNTLVDMGFGEPTLYVKEAIRTKDIKISLCDYADSAFEFAQAVLEQYSPNWKQIVSFKKLDMESGEYVGDFDLYIFQDSIEHIHQPANFLKSYVQKSPSHANFILSLPIGPIIPVHYIAWSSTEEAASWLKDCGLEIISSKNVYTNPEVDLFADFAETYCDFYVLCKKVVN